MNINIRLLLPLMGVISGWFLFEEMILGAIIFALAGFGIWFKHNKKNKSKNYPTKKSRIIW